MTLALLPPFPFLSFPALPSGRLRNAQLGLAVAAESRYFLQSTLVTARLGVASNSVPESLRAAGECFSSWVWAAVYSGGSIDCRT